MRDLNNILERLLDNDFDVNVEPVEIPKLHHPTLQHDIEVPLQFYNNIVVYYGPFHKVVDSINEFTNIAGSEYQDGAYKEIALQFNKILKTAEKNCQELSTESYQKAIVQLQKFRELIPTIIEMDETLYGVAKKLHIKDFACQIDDRWKWDRGVFDVWFLKKQRPAEDVVVSFINSATEQLNKIKNLTASTDDGVIEIKLK